jgi:hypothetical protein
MLGCAACQGLVDLTAGPPETRRCPCGRTIAWVEAGGDVSFHGPGVPLAGELPRRPLAPLL